MEQQVTVIGIEAEMAIVRGNRASACGDCAGKASCSTLGSWNQRTLELKLKNSLGARVGDDVIIEVPDHAVLRTSFRLYAVPMLAFIVVGLAIRSLALSFAWPAPDALAALAGIAAVLLYYFGGGRHGGGNSDQLDVRMTRLVTTSDAAAQAKCYISPD